MNAKQRIMLLAIAFTIIAAFAYFAAGEYTTHVEGKPVNDIVLDNVGPFDVWYLYTFGYLLTIVFILAYPFLSKTISIWAVLIQYSLLLIIRSAFIVMTHLHTPATAGYYGFPGPFSMFSFDNDLFFSGHVAIPFLGFWVFPGKVRYVFLALAILFAGVVLLGHLHYSIDVFAAFFIAFGSFHIGSWIITQAQGRRVRS